MEGYVFMSRRKLGHGGFSRRQFIRKCAVMGVLVWGLGIQTSCRVGKVASQSGGRYRYRALPDWPRLPRGVSFEGVNGIAVDSRGYVYAAGGAENAVLVFDPNGKYVGSWGKGIIGTKHELRIFEDTVWVGDTMHHQVYEFTLDGKLLRSLGTRDHPGEGPNEFNKPTDIAFAPNGDMYVCDGYGNRRMVCLNPDGSFRLAWGRKGTGPGEFDPPHNVVVDAEGRVYVADRENLRIQIFGPNGRFLKQWRHVGKPFGLYLTPDQTLFVTDGSDKGPHRVLILDLDGRILATFGETGGGPGQFNIPHSIHVDRYGNVYVAEVGNKRIQKFVPLP